MRCEQITCGSLFLLSLGILCASWIPFGIYTNYIFVEAPSHLHQTNCKINYCNISNTTCYYIEHRDHHHDEDKKIPFICYRFIANYSYENFTKIFDSGYDLSGNYPTVCNYPTVNCFYDDLDMYNSLTLELLYISKLKWGFGLFGMILLTSGVITGIVFLILWVCCWMRLDYEPIRSEKPGEHKFDL